MTAAPPEVKLSEADRDAVSRAAREAADFSRKTVREAIDQQLADMTEKGATVTTPDVGPFREAVMAAPGPRARAERWAVQSASWKVVSSIFSTIGSVVALKSA